MTRFLASFAVPAVVGAALLIACSDPTILPYCTDIPAGGCPGADAGLCVADPTCSAIYLRETDCTWTLVHRCAGNHATDAAAHGDATSDAGVVDGSVGLDAAVRDAGFNLPEGAAGGPGCTGLELPDCAVEEALVCGGSCCGCQSLFVCVNGGWNLWGSCADGGVVATP